MNKRKVSLLLMAVPMILLFAGCAKESSLKKITVNEVAHSIFYAPQYVAIEKGYFEEEGLDVKLVTGFGADKTMTALLSGEADIGFMGSESSVYVYNEGAKDYVVNFSRLTQRAGNFLVSRNTSEDFKWENLKGKTVIGGRPGGMPQMIFEYILKKNGFDLENDITISQNIDFGMTAEAFQSGTEDYTVEFEPAATALEKSGSGKVVASLGVESGMVPYTAYSARKSYMEENPDIIQSFTNAIQKGLVYVNAHTPEEIADIIAPQFKETEKEDLIKIVTRYYEQETWKNDSIFEEQSFELLQNILDEAGELTARVPYTELVNTTYAEKAASEIKTSN